ncbi:2-oxoglutarate dehydrogenase, E2 component, dihydrolipoamide succinyltransferase [Salinibacterium sp. dk2585]|uniref:2-oxoglutarate dehydrogenase, E2 component, dihydrolipoamide succinyltransferase n=1 Tax=unclassified Salinibacterium TaxID=2632331 RepID=UPI0011C24DF7|nr:MULTISPECIES: 2-oxoglutarate dehydrogenase, E2 component, dihydrolipoamide succinyltransferase [unclassified Salinibacterium]QEE61332.1 2-oxoglutarate dehydrogenase, E2 component, dihydrolipoamide succinyltransferase [Salinibacterium sp. dk2585]TXK54009.1 2-oxoglutarate dehydrogenase, E2 component, dihydrolipoamide succinyltransferase [Salinibacterium sp. dk5596]
MSQSVNLPALGESVTEGTVTRWLKNVGDRVEVDEPLLEVSTDKVDTEIPSPIAGVIEEILVAEDETVEVGAPLVRIGDGSSEGGEPEAPAESAPAAEEAAPAEAAAPSEDSAPEPASPSQEQAEPQQEEAPQAEVQSAPAASGGQAVTLPSLGESVTEGTVTRILKQVGDSVEVDEPLLEISTDKVDTEIPSPIAGIVQEILVAEDQTIEIGAELLRIGSGASAGAAEAAQDQPQQAEQPQREEQAAPQQEYLPSEPPAAVPSPAQEEPAKASESQAAEADAPDGGATTESVPSASVTHQPAEEQAGATAPAAVPAASASSSSSSGYVTPIVRKLAAEKGVDLSTVSGSGVGGRIRKEDVLEAAKSSGSASEKPAETAASTPAPKLEISALRGTTVPMTRLRKVVAERAVISMQSSAQLTTVVEVDVTKVAALRSRVKDAFLEKTGTKLSFLPFFALAASEALQAYPIINATIDGENIVYPPQENLSIAVDTERGLLTPVIRDAGSLDIAGLAKEIADLAERTRENKLKPDELAGGTFTLTNTGSRGALFDTPVVFLPQSAILGTGIVTKRPVVVQSEGVEAISIRSMVYLALSYDHRIIDGADASRFLVAVKSRLEEGNFEGSLGI